MLDTWNALTFGDLNAKYCGIKFAGKASRDSGKITTSLGNTILTWSVIQMCFIEYLMDKQGYTFEACLDIIRTYGGLHTQEHMGDFAVEGDDNTVVFKDRALIEYLRTVPARMGFKLTIEATAANGPASDNIRIEFCKIVAHRDVSGEISCAKTFAWNFIKATLMVDSAIKPYSKRAILMV